MTIVAADAVPTKLLTVTCLDVNLGQRCAKAFVGFILVGLRPLLGFRPYLSYGVRRQPLSCHRTLMCPASR